MFGDPWPEEPADPFPGNTDPFPAYSERVVVPGERPRRPVRPPANRRATAVQSGLLALTAVFRIGLFALAIGPMLVAFRGADYWGQASRPSASRPVPTASTGIWCTAERSRARDG